jgi:hypothetical protein
MIAAIVLAPLTFTYSRITFISISITAAVKFKTFDILTKASWTAGRFRLFIKSLVFFLYAARTAETY